MAGELGPAMFRRAEARRERGKLGEMEKSKGKVSGNGEGARAHLQRGLGGAKMDCSGGSTGAGVQR